MDGYTAAEVGGILAFTVVFFSLFFLFVAFYILQYVLYSMGLYRIAKRREIRHAWLAWVPIANAWLLGCISDQYRYVVKGKNAYRRVILTVLVVLGTLAGCGSTLSAFTEIANMPQYIDSTFMDPGMREISWMISTTWIAALLRLAGFVYRQMSLYDLYSSCVPENRALYLVLGILFRFLEPFFVFFSRDKELGMPPRRVLNPQSADAWQQADAAEPWDTVE